MTPLAPRLTREAFDRARTFLLERGRSLEAARFRHAFEGGSVGEVLAALDAYQNLDGGFGRVLEPDVRAPHSSVLATSLALRALHKLEVPASDVRLVRALGWLHAGLQATPHGMVWPFLPPEAQEHPHAPWWSQAGPGQLAATFGAFRVNPRAELVALLWRWPELLPTPLLTELTAEVRDAILAGLEPGDVNGHHVAAVFAQTPEVPGAYRLPVLEYLHDVLPDRVARAPEDFAAYGLSALTVAPTPTSPLARGLEEALAAALTHLLTSQDGDGSWAPNWSWGGLFPDAWQGAEREWRSALTLEALLTLRRWGRLENAT